MNAKFSEDDQEELASEMHKAVGSLNVAKLQSLLASGVPSDVWGITEDYDLPLQAVSRRDGDNALPIVKAPVEAGADIDFQGDYNCTALARATEASGESNQSDWAIARY